ncbi:MAG: hypothetical protein B6244_05550 [Candidatus Cloacimonetes bacterium 4572_55]|nr:MAG: hypothetical protein B6244_05550 [Candidatus Cloacimonetes bacterium 4572_55]
MVRTKILVVDDEESLCEMLSIMLHKEGYEVHTCLSGTEALKKMEKSVYPAVIADINMPNSISGLDLLAAIKERGYHSQVIMMTAFASLESAISALNSGAFAYITKPFKIDEVKAYIKRALDHQFLREENRFLKKQLNSKLEARPIIGNSGPIKKIFEMIKQVAHTDSVILIRGESGTGKELIAREIHRQSSRSSKKFISVNCGALTETLLESELFGHVKGAFTGAIREKKGLFAEAEEGTFFLDEIGEISLSTQVKLLRVLQELEVIPVGSVQAQPIDARLIAATNADLENLIRLGKFRQDLFYRLSVIPIDVPPLRGRKEDIVLLCDHFLKKHSNGRKSVSKEVIERFQNYEWPGNVRELENLIERLVVLTKKNEICFDDIPKKIFASADERLCSGSNPVNPTMETVEKAYIFWVLSQTNWHRNEASQVLGIDPSTLSRKVSRYKLDRRS